jgi:hypothetical protein
MALQSLSTRELRRELDRRESGVKKLQSQRAALAGRLAEIDAELAEFGIVGAAGRRGSRGGRKGKAGRATGGSSKATGKGTGRKRAKNAMTLPEAILKHVAVGVTVSPAQAAVAAKKAGYKSSSSNFGMIVANALSKDRRFKKLGRGQYQRAK